MGKVFANIIYEKNDILITKVELQKYKELYSNSMDENLSEMAVIKKIVLLKRTINNLLIRNPDFMKKIDDSIRIEIGENNFNDEVKKNYYRFFKIRNEFIFEYFRSNFNENDLKKVFSSFNEMMIPLSLNKCLTIADIVDLKENENFIQIYFYNLKNNIKEFEVEIDNQKYSACINDNIYKAIESRVINYLENSTEEEFNNYIYGK